MSADGWSRESIMEEIREEREQQDSLFGSSIDDQHGASDWIAILVRHAGLASFDGTPAGMCGLESSRKLATADPVRFRRQMIRCAAVALAAVESIDRQGLIQSDHLASYRERGRQMATAYQETVILVDGADPTRQPRDAPSPYAELTHAVRSGLRVLLARFASPWEIEHAIERYEPQ